jgi:uncharacterized surface protein with fasciclin (FAS1) repeats
MENETPNNIITDKDKKANDKAIKFLISLAVGALLVGLLGFGIGYAVRGSGQKPKPAQEEITPKDTSASSETDGVTVGGVKLVRSQDITDNLTSAPTLSSLVSFHKQAQISDKLKLPGPFTVFAPTNDAFSKLPEGTSDALTRTENKKLLTDTMSYQIVPGTYTSADLKVMAQKGETLKTLQGSALTPILDENLLKIKDANGTIAGMETSDAVARNGIIHTIDGFLTQ